MASVARAVFARKGTPTRADIASVTGLTRSTVSRLVDELVAGGILSEDEPAPPLGRGRPGVPLRAATDTYVSLGLEANVEYLACYAVDLTGEVLARRIERGNWTGADPGSTLSALAGLAREVFGTVPGVPLGVQVALPGIVAPEAGLLLRAPNLRWSEVDVRTPLAGLVPPGKQVGVANEADCAALAIAHERPGRLRPDLSSFIYVSGNVGIGSATIAAGQTQGGNHGWAGELGHVCVDPAGPTCGCGAAGCLEAFLGRSALLRRCGYTAWTDLVAAAASPDPGLRPHLDEAGHALGIALSSALNLLDVSEVVIGGQLAALAPALLPATRAELDRRVLAAPYAPVRISYSTTTDALGALGAAYRGVLEMLNDPAASLVHARTQHP